MEDYAKKRQLLQHLEALLSHLNDWKEDASEVITNLQKIIEQSYLEGILLLVEWCFDLGYAQKVREWSEKALVINEKQYGPDHPEVAIMEI